jgi:hypothetical protein
MSESIAVSTPHHGTEPEKPYNATERAKLILAENEEKFYTFAMLAGRWGVNQKVAARRVKALGLPLVRWNQRTACVRLSDILRAERDATV